MIVVLHSPSPEGATVLVNPAQVRFVRDVGANRHIIFDDQTSVFVTEPLEEVRTILNNGLR